MTLDMGNARIALLEARMTSELAGLVRNHGGEPICVPAVKEAPLDCAKEVSAFIDRLCSGGYHSVIFLTGVGVRALFKEAATLGRESELSAALKTVTTICRGPKPGSVLRQKGIQVSVSAPEPFTTKELLEAAADLDFSGKRICLLHYGQRNSELTAALEARGALVDELCLYEWQMPEDTAGLEQLIAQIVAGQIDCVAFTSQVQVIHLFQAAGRIAKTDALKESLSKRTVVASIGPTTTACLLNYGIRPKIEPEHPKMGYLVNSMASHFSANTPAETGPAGAA